MTQMIREGMYPESPYALVDLWYGATELAKASPSPEDFEANFRAYQAFADRLMRNGFYSGRERLWFYAPRLAQLSAEKESFQAALSYLEDFVFSLIAQGIHPSDSLLALPLVLEFKPDLAFYQGSMSSLRRLSLVLAKKGATSLWEGLGAMCQGGFPAIARISSTPEEFEAHLPLLERLVEVMADRNLPLGNDMMDSDGLPLMAALLTKEQFLAGMKLAIRLAEKGIHPWGVLGRGLPAADGPAVRAMSS